MKYMCSIHALWRREDERIVLSLDGLDVWTVVVSRFSDLNGGSLFKIHVACLDWGWNHVVNILCIIYII